VQLDQDFCVVHPFDLGEQRFVNHFGETLYSEGLKGSALVEMHTERSGDLAQDLPREHRIAAQFKEPSDTRTRWIPKARCDDPLRFRPWCDILVRSNGRR
jgi:hypothetical protein